MVSPQEFATARFNKELVFDTSWGNGGQMIYNGDGDDDDWAVDICVWGDINDRYVAVTGTSIDDENSYDIVTMVYYTEDSTNQPRQLSDPDAWTDWRSVFDHPTEHSSDFAVELAPAKLVEQEQPGVGIVVAGSTYAGSSGFDMVAMAYLPRTGAEHWTPVMYNGPADDNDLCTGLAALGDSTGALTLCGVTPAYESYPNDTEYLLWAVHAGDGSDYWDDEGTYGVGRAWNPGADEQGTDIPYDICYGYIDDDLVAFVTGECEVGSTIDIGTIGYYVTGTPGELYEENVYDSPVADGRDDRGLSIAFSDALGIYVTGGTESYGDPSTLTIHYSSSLVVEDLARYVGEGLYNQGRKVYLHIDNNNPSGTGIYVTGTTGVDGLGLDFCTFRYDVP